MPTNIEISRAYAAAILAIASAEDVVEQVESDLRDTVTFFNDNTELREFLANPAVGGEGRRETMEKLLSNRVHPIVAANIALLAEQGHGRLVPEVVEDFISDAAQSRGTMTAEVTSAVELSDGQKDRLRRSLTDRTGRAIVLRTMVDPSIGGGVVVRVGDQIMDGSVNHNIERLRAGLAAG